MTQGTGDTRRDSLRVDSRSIHHPSDGLTCAGVNSRSQLIHHIHGRVHRCGRLWEDETINFVITDYCMPLVNYQ